MFLRHIILAGLLAGASGAQADTVIFADDFDTTTALNKTVFPGGWTVTNGSVDVIGTDFIDVFPGNGNYVDLDGSTGDAGELSKSLILTGGLSYTAMFSLAGSHRGGSDIVDVMFGTASASFTLAGIRSAHPRWCLRLPPAATTRSPLPTRAATMSVRCSTTSASAPFPSHRAMPCCLPVWAASA